ncbi:MAG: hypothetical protein GC192_12260 [Bacteroidetes bacterium]|nr:hypothetical protein [Bacteroidota bacterium]
MNSTKGFVAMSAGLVSVLLLGFHTYNLSAERAAKAHRIELLQDEIRDFGILKTYLTGQVDSLQQAYEALAMSHMAILNRSEAVTKQKLAEKAAIIKNLEVEEPSKVDVNILKSKVEDLLKLKSLLERDIAELSTENEEQR